VGRLFTPKIAEFYENYYTSKGVTFIKGTTVSSLEISSGKVSFRCLSLKFTVYDLKISYIQIASRIIIYHSSSDRHVSLNHEDL